MRVRFIHKRIGLVLVLAWIIVIGMAAILPVGSQNTSTVEYIPVADIGLDYSSPTAQTSQEAWVLGSSGRYKVVFKFNLSDFSLSADRIVSATLKVFITDRTGTNSETAQAVEADDNWNETSGSPTLGDSITSVTFDCVSCYKEFNVTDYVVSQLNSGDKIISIGIKGGLNVAYKVAMREHTNETIRPRLIIEYEPYTETTTTTITAVSYTHLTLPTTERV